MARFSLAAGGCVSLADNHMATINPDLRAVGLILWEQAAEGRREPDAKEQKSRYGENQFKIAVGVMLGHRYPLFLT